MTQENYVTRRKRESALKFGPVNKGIEKMDRTVYPSASREQMVDTMRQLIESEFDIRNEGEREYAHAPNVFANFCRIAQNMDLTPEKVLMVYALKHMDGIVSWVNGHRSQRENVEGRIKDLRIYMAILHAMVKAYEDGNTVSNLTELPE